MTKREKAIERLACDICWAGFNNPKDAGCSKLQYWSRVTEESKHDYRWEAWSLLWITKRLGLPRIEAALTATDGNTA